MPAYDISLTVPAAPGPWRNPALADRLAAGLLALSGPVSGARLESRTARRLTLVRARAVMRVTAGGPGEALGTAVDALREAAGDDAPERDLAAVTAVVAPAAVRLAAGSGRRTGLTGSG